MKQYLIITASILTAVLIVVAAIYVVHCFNEAQALKRDMAKASADLDTGTKAFRYSQDLEEIDADKEKMSDATTQDQKVYWAGQLDAANEKAKADDPTPTANR